MAFELNQTAVSGASLLRAIDAGGWTNKAELAERAGRLRNHMARDLGTMEKAGLIVQEPNIALTDEGRAQLAAIARAEGETPGGELLPDERLVTHDQLRADPDNPRKDFESDDAQEKLDELRQSILLNGLLQNLVVRPDPDEIADFIVTAGNRRWHAIQQAIFDADWPEDRPIRVKVVDGDAKGSLLTAIVENKQRADMSAIEEAEAFGRLIDDHGMKTIEIAEATGLSQKVVQNRLKLLKLSADDQDRMRLPEDHPDHLGYKAALRQLTVAREPEPAPQPEPVNDEPGSPPEVPANPAPAVETPPTPQPSFGSRITDREALILVELTDKAEREPDPDHGSEHYTRVQSDAMHGAARDLLAKGLLATRQRGMVVLMKPVLYSTGLKGWLTDLGFYQPDQRAAVLFEMRTRVHGPDVAQQLAKTGTFATGWLNPAGDPPALPNGAQPSASGLGAALAREQVEAEQPELIEATEEEKAAKRRADEDRAALYAAGESLNALMSDALSWWKASRETHQRDWLVFNPSNTLTAPSGDQLAWALMRALAVGSLPEAMVIMALIRTRYGAQGAPRIFGTLPVPQTTLAMIQARVERQRAINGDPAEDDTPDPVDTFVEEEVEEGLDEHPESFAQGERSADGQEPAVPIRKSIHPDYIVCLEDGRKFKSLKRHLRTRYNLSPEEYRAKWGLPADYPMVAPNYAKARADLARQMGLATP